MTSTPKPLTGAQLHALDRIHRQGGIDQFGTLNAHDNPGTTRPIAAQTLIALVCRRLLVATVDGRLVLTDAGAAQRPKKAAP